jgi:hypothetical protein
VARIAAHEGGPRLSRSTRLAPPRSPFVLTKGLAKARSFR